MATFYKDIMDSESVNPNILSKQLAELGLWPHFHQLTNI